MESTKVIGQRGRKPCPSCKKSVGVRTSKCDCGHVFYERKTQPTPKVEGKKGQRGRKFCPSCNSSVGVRTAKCNCGHEFSVSVRSSKPTASKPTHKYVRGLTTICTPAGEPPVKLYDQSVEAVRNWAEAIRLHGQNNGKNYTSGAVVYFLRYFVDIHSETFTILKEAIYDVE